MKFSIIIPCYNEFENIANLINNISSLQNNYDLEYVLVENGSIDRSRQYFKDNVEGKYKNIQVVYVEKNKGYGYGLQQGLKAAVGDYVGWIHADLQIPPEELMQFFNEIFQHEIYEKIFLKGLRKNRSLFDRFFTNGQSLFNTLLFKRNIYDVGAIPVLFNRTLLDEINIDDMPNDFSIELYIYAAALKRGYLPIRFKVKLLNRNTGQSSWNTGLKSKIKQSKRIFFDSLKIKRGEKVL